MEEAQVLDLFSGTGNLGFEALSWGAKSVQMVEINPRSIAIIRKNMEHLKITDGIEIYKGDAVTYVKKYTGSPYNIILIDPPFPLKICNTILEEISKSTVANSETRIVIEHARQEPVESVFQGLRCIDTRSYGDKLVSFFKKEG
jgi:16S rRNA (guanine966-N2)-methyltransferase